MLRRCCTFAHKHARDRIERHRELQTKARHQIGIKGAGTPFRFVLRDTSKESGRAKKVVVVMECATSPRLPPNSIRKCCKRVGWVFSVHCTLEIVFLCVHWYISNTGGCSFYMKCKTTSSFSVVGALSMHFIHHHDSPPSSLSLLSLVSVLNAFLTAVPCISATCHLSGVASSHRGPLHFLPFSLSSFTFAAPFSQVIEGKGPHRSAPTVLFLFPLLP